MAAGADLQQFNVYLPRELVRRAKHAAVDEGVSLSRLVEQALTSHLSALAAKYRNEDEDEDEDLS